jgi:hypothetical protein
MAKSPALVVGNDRTNAIAAKIRDAMRPITEADEVRAENRDQAKALNEAGETGAVNARELVLGALADAATAGDWTLAEVQMGAVLMAKQSNNELPKSIATFVGEAKLAMHPDVREGFANIVLFRNAAWEAEELAKALDKNAPQPIRKLVKRKYHLLTRIMSEGIKGNWLTTVEEIVDFCAARDPELDAKVSYKQLEKLRAELARMTVAFPDADLVAAVDTLNKVQLAHMEAARAEALGEDVPATTVARPNVSPAVSQARVKNPPATVVAESAEDDAGTGAVDVDDLLDGVLDANTAQLKAA